MKASKILAGLSAVSLAASMLSMVAASADDEKLTATGFTDDEVVTDTEKVADADLPFGGQHNWAAKWGNKKWYNPFIPTTTNTKFGGWPGWGVAEFPDSWELAVGLKTTKDIVWETYGENDVDPAVPGYLVYEFENGNKWLVPASVDKNGAIDIEEVYIPYTNVSRIYFLYEVSENPYFQVALDKFIVNGKEVQLNKDNWKDEVKYVGNTSTGEKFLMDVTNNGPTEVDNGLSYYLVEGYDADGNIVYGNYGEPISIENYPMYYQATIFDKTNTAQSVINHGLILWNAKVKVEATASNIGFIDSVHGKVGADAYNGTGDNDGDPHTHVDPDEAGGNGVQTQNIDEYPVNPKFAPGDRCSADLYDALVEVYNSDPEHKADAEISFKTVSDKGGVLVANFLNVWEKDEVRQADGSMKQKYWLKDFVDGYAVYVKKDGNIPVGLKKETIKVYKYVVEDGQSKPVPIYGDGKTEGEKVLKGYETEDLEITHDGKTFYYPVNKENDPTQGKWIGFDLEKVEHWVFDTDDDRNGKPIAKDGSLLLPTGEVEEYIEGKATGVTYKIYPSEDDKYLPEDKTEEAYCWHPYFVTENGLVDVVTKNYLGNYKTNVPNYNSLTSDEIKYLKDNNGMYYNDNIHHAAYGHFIVFGDNTEREYSYRINADAVKAILDTVQRSIVEREYYIYRHGAEDIYAWQVGTDSVQFGPNNELVVTGDHPDGFTKDYESQHWLDSQIATDPDGANKDDRYPHARATHGAVWLQCCEGTYLRDVHVKTYTTLLKENEVPVSLYGKENYASLYPTKPAESAASSASAAAPAPAAADAAADGNAD
ncbi:MAG: hypothetical protein K6B74_05885, partial [Ruminococcus sp.]|nr:hypothetical protein [Ruminococcus sp.]